MYFFGIVKSIFKNPPGDMSHALCAMLHDNISVDVYTDVDGQQIALASKAMAIGTGDDGGEDAAGVDNSVRMNASWGCTLTAGSDSAGGLAMILMIIGVSALLGIRNSKLETRRKFK